MGCCLQHSTMPVWIKQTQTQTMLGTMCLGSRVSYQAFQTEYLVQITSCQVLATKYSVSASQICGRWALQRVGSLALSSGCDPATAPAYTKENLGLFSFNLSAAEMGALAKLNHTAVASRA